MDIGEFLKMGLVHISSLAIYSWKIPPSGKTGNIVKVKVLEVDVLRKRIALTMIRWKWSKWYSKSDRILSARPRGNMQREARNCGGNNAMGNALLMQLKIGKNK